MSPSNSLKGNRTKLDLINGVWRGFCHKQSALCSSFQCYNSWSAAALHVQTKTMNSVWYVSQFKTNDGEFLRWFFSFFGIVLIICNLRHIFLHFIWENVFKKPFTVYECKSHWLNRRSLSEFSKFQVYHFITTWQIGVPTEKIAVKWVAKPWALKHVVGR